MTFDASLPADNTKIRNLGIVIRPNWAAIETGASSFKPQAINLTDRTVAGVSVDPTAIADCFIDYCKTDTAGNSEFFGIDENSHVLQYSYGGRVGGPTTGASFLNLSFGAGTIHYTQNNMSHSYGRFQANGTTLVASNCTIVRSSSGVYTVTFSTPLLTANYSVVATAYNDGGGIFICKIANQVAASFQINCYSGASVLTDNGCSFMVCGGY